MQGRPEFHCDGAVNDSGTGGGHTICSVGCECPDYRGAWNWKRSGRHVTIHVLSLRASREMVAVNTGGLAEGVFESELFGHVKGAFTDARTDRIGRFELADGGTIFLDEIGNVPMRQQSKLLRVLESGEIERVGSSRSKRVDVRLISATNSDLQAACQAGRFREDLLFRLDAVEIHLPAFGSVARISRYLLSIFFAPMHPATGAPFAGSILRH